MIRQSYVAEREGFEPSRGSTPLLAFQASAFNRSTTSPHRRSAGSIGGPTVVVGVLLALVLVGATPAGGARHAVTGHYNVPRETVPNPVASPSGNVVTNSGFESGSIDEGWYQCGDVKAYTTTAHPFSGLYDAYSGTPSGAEEPQGNSGICQRVTVPPAGLLTARLYQLSDESDATFAYEEADLLDARGNVVLNLYRAVNNKAAWKLGRWNLAAYAGRTFWLYFGVHGDGHPELSTEQFVDDVVLSTANSQVSK